MRTTPGGRAIIGQRGDRAANETPLPVFCSDRGRDEESPGQHEGGEGEGEEDLRQDVCMNLTPSPAWRSLNLTPSPPVWRGELHPFTRDRVER